MQRVSANASIMVSPLTYTSALGKSSSHSDTIKRALSISVEAAALTVWTVVQRTPTTSSTLGATYLKCTRERPVENCSLRIGAAKSVFDQSGTHEGPPVLRLARTQCL